METRKNRRNIMSKKLFLSYECEGREKGLEILNRNIIDFLFF